MPKTRAPKIQKQAGKSIPLRIKFKLGGRKGVTSALSLSNNELLKKYFSANHRGKDKRKIMQVLHMRNVELIKELETENED